MAKGKPKMDFSRVSRGLQEKNSEQTEETSAKSNDIVADKQGSGSTSDLVKKMSALHHSQASSSYDIKNIPIDKIHSHHDFLIFPKLLIYIPHSITKIACNIFVIIRGERNSKISTK